MTLTYNHNIPFETEEPITLICREHLPDTLFDAMDADRDSIIRDLDDALSRR